MKYGLGWKQQKKDPRDLVYMKSFLGQKFPMEIILEDPTPVLDQSVLGSCTAHGILGNISRELVVNCKLPYSLASRLALYWLERYQEGSVNSDDGAEIRDGIKAANLWGIADESLWPYDIAKFREKPPKEYFIKAEEGKIHFYASVDFSNVNNVKLAISHGHGVVFGTPLFGDFENYTSGLINVPNLNDQLLGGHCMFLEGYSDAIGGVYAKNSWSDQWGDKGFCWFSYAYMQQYFMDGWVTRLK